MIRERWSRLLNVTTSVPGSDCVTSVVKPGAGSAETRQTAPFPKLIEACPPLERTVCAPTPP